MEEVINYIKTEGKKARIMGIIFLIISYSGLIIINTVVRNYNNNLEKTNQNLKKEKYELKQKLEKAENDRLKCLVGIGE